MKAISLWEPFASAMALGLKHNETRSWRTNYRGPLAIHAAKRKIQPGEMSRLDCVLPAGFAPQYGKILCVVNLVELVPSSVYLDCTLTDTVEFILGDYSPGRWVWKTQSLWKLPHPVAATGHQGFWDVPQAALDEIFSRPA